MRKARLMTPGPTPVHPAAAAALAAPHPHHRTPRFREVISGLRASLADVFRTRGEMVLLTCSGTGAMEASLVSLTRPGDQVMVVDSGKFGGRWRDLCAAHGREAVVIRPDPRQAVTPEEVGAAAAAHPRASALCLAACESSTGVGVDVQAVAAAARAAAGDRLLLLVDAITAVGAAPLEADAWDLDVVIGGSQKAFMVPPGLAFLSLSTRAQGRLGETGGGGLYLDLARELKAQREGSTAWTPSTALAFALEAALAALLAEGMEAVWAATERRARMTRAAVAALGLTLYPRSPAPSLTAVEAPPGLDSGSIVASLEQEFGVRIAGGQGSLKGRIFRLAHMGYIDEVETLGTLGALGITLRRLGVDADPAAGLAAATRILTGES